MACGLWPTRIRKGILDVLPDTLLDSLDLVDIFHIVLILRLECEMDLLLLYDAIQPLVSFQPFSNLDQNIYFTKY